MGVAGVVLAAGRSSRMGRPKALLPYRGRSFLDGLVAALEACGASPRLVVVGDDPAVCEEARRTGAELVVNPRPQEGMLSSIAAALDRLAPEVAGALVWPVDHPAAREATARALLAAFAAEPAPVVLPTCGGRRGHPVLFARAVFDELRRAPAALGARAVVRAHEGRLREVEVGDEGVLLDVDVPGDLARL